MRPLQDQGKEAPYDPGPHGRKSEASALVPVHKAVLLVKGGFDRAIHNTYGCLHKFWAASNRGDLNHSNVCYLGYEWPLKEYVCSKLSKVIFGLKHECMGKRLGRIF